MSHKDLTITNLKDSIKSLNNAQIELEFMWAQEKCKVKKLEIDAMISNIRGMLANIEGLLSLIEGGN